MQQAISVVRAVLKEITVEAARDPHIECCGLLGGAGDVITRIYPAVNALASAIAFEIAPGELFSIMRRMRAGGVEMMGIYHSHPRGENYPSSSDIARAFYPEAVYFIASPLPGAPHPLRAFRICNGQISELLVETGVEVR